MSELKSHIKYLKLSKEKYDSSLSPPWSQKSLNLLNLSVLTKQKISDFCSNFTLQLQQICRMFVVFLDGSDYCSHYHYFSFISINHLIAVNSYVEE